jgi:hypothetical protein
MLGVQLLVSAANVATWEDGVALRVIDLNTEANLPTWWSSTLLLAIGATAAGLWLCERRLGRRRTHWLLVALGFGALSVEEVAGIHERFGYYLDVSGGVTDWPLLYLPVLGVGAAALARTLRDLGRPRAIMVLAGLALFVGVVVAEVASMWTVAGAGDTLSLGETLFEENSELAGQALVLLALAWQLTDRVAALELCVPAPAAQLEPLPAADVWTPAPRFLRQGEKRRARTRRS